jgi:cysteine-rich repeat protein
MNVPGVTRRCGDGTVNAPIETCDDGGTTPGDGCNATCQIEVNCDSWLVTYSLGSPANGPDPFTLFELDGSVAGMPIDRQAGPGTITLRFENIAGVPTGHVQLEDFDLDYDFSVTVAGTTVTSDTNTQTDPTALGGACGFGTGFMTAATTLAWDVPWSPVDTTGVLSCTGPFCGFVEGLGPFDVQNHEFGEWVDGTPPVTDPVLDFTFNGAFNRFATARMLLVDDANGQQYITFGALETGRTLVGTATTPTCFCAAADLR